MRIDKRTWKAASRLMSVVTATGLVLGLGLWAHAQHLELPVGEIRSDGTGTNYFMGSVGIGTTSASGKLHVNNTDDSYMYYSSTGNLYAYNPEGSTAQVRLGAAWNRPGVYSSKELQLFSDITGIIFGDSNIERMRLTAGGNLGIGTTSPSAKLEVAGWYGRTAHNNGGLVGSYNNVGANSYNSGPIYVIGSSYKPNSTTLNNMYGIGYTHTNASFITDPGPNTWGMYVAADGDARIWLGASSGAHSYFNSGGNVGIGTTTPSQKLQVNGTAQVSTLRFDDGSSMTSAPSGGGGGSVWSTSGTAAYYNTGNVGIGTSTPQRKLHINGANPRFMIEDTSGTTSRWELMVNSTNFHVRSWNAAYSTVTERLIIKDNGNVGIGTMSPGSLLDIEQTIGADYGALRITRGANYWAFHQYANGTLAFTGNGAQRVEFELGGVTRNGSGVWAFLSDRRMKRDIRPMVGALNTVAQLRGVSFRWKDAARDKETGKVQGFVAQDVEEVRPDWVIEDKRDGLKRLHPVGINALLVEAIKELKAESDKIKAELDAEKAENDQKVQEMDQMEKRLERLEKLLVK